MKTKIKTTMKQVWGLSAVLSLLAFGISSQAAVTLYTTTFDEAIDKGDASALRGDTAWQASNTSAWTWGSGNTWVYNSATGSDSGNDGNAAEGALVKVLDLSSAGLVYENSLNLSFNYSAWGAEAGSGVDDLYIHVWGFTDVNSSATTELAELWMQEGNSWGELDASEYSKLTRYNLKDGSVLAAGNSSSAGTQAITMDNISLSATNDGTQANASFLLSSTGRLANYDYLVVSFTRNVADASGEAFAIRDFTLEAIAPTPEPSTLGLMAMGAGLLAARRRHFRSSSI